MQMEPKKFNKLADLGFAIGDIKDGKTITNEDELKEANREILNSADIDSQEILHVQKFEFVDNLDFGKAIEALKRGHRIKRRDWKGYWILDKFEEDGSPLIIACLANGTLAAAQPYQSDILAEDWEIIIE
jgi:hypothetical protein